MHYSEVIAYSPEAYSAAVEQHACVEEAAKLMVLYGEEAKAYFAK